MSCGTVGWGWRIHWLPLCRRVRLPQQVPCGTVGWGWRIHWLPLCRRVRLSQQVSCGPVGWGCRIHWLPLCKGVKLPQQVSCGPVGWGWRIHWQHLCRRVRLSSMSVLYNDTKKSDGETPGVIAPDRILSMDQIELNFVLMQNWIVWNITALTFKLHTYAKLNCLK